jgi:hypothetical protein
MLTHTWELSTLELAQMLVVPSEPGGMLTCAGCAVMLPVGTE